MSMSISVDSPSYKISNRGPLALLLQRQYEFPFGINIVPFSIFNFQDRWIKLADAGNRTLDNLRLSPMHFELTLSF